MNINISFLISLIYSILFHTRDGLYELFIRRKVNIDQNILNKYLKKNKEIWIKQNVKKLNKENILITNFVHHPGYTIMEGLFGNYLSNHFGLNAFALIDYKDKFGKKIIDSFGITNFINHYKITLFYRIRYLFASYTILKKVKSIDDFIDFNFQDINFGRCVYDHIIRHTSYGTIDQINYKVFFFLSEALFFDMIYKNFFNKYKFSYISMGETQYLPSSIIFQNALKHNVKVICRIGGPKKIGARVYNSKDERLMSNFKIQKKSFEKKFSQSKKIISAKGYENLNKIFAGEEYHPDPNSEINFNLNNQNSKNKNELLKIFNWDESRKICIIFSHNLFDGNYNNQWRIFKDNLTWLRETLNYIKKLNQNVYWIVKDHPSDYGANKNKNTTFKEFKKIIGNNKNIQFYPKEFSTNLIKDIADCILTSQGSAGLEYPCFGIPSIICGDSYYQGLGFTKEPKDEKEYFIMINNIETIISTGLDETQIERARAAYYFTEHLTKIDHPLLFNYNIGRKSLNLDEFFLNALEKINQYKFEDDFFNLAIKEMLDKEHKHTFFQKN
jgi:hypothetical protein